MLSLQFITHQTENYSYLESARMALEGGCKWIQLRMKEASPEEVEAVALQLKPLCKAKEAILILDDHVELAKKLGLEGYTSILAQMNEADIRIPVVAIGGIVAEDIPAIMETGVNGIALSGAILQAPDPVEETKRILNI